MRNFGVIAAALAVLVVAFVLLQGAGDEGSGTSAGTETTQATAAPAATPEPTAATTTTEAAPAPKPKPKPAVPTVTFEDGEAKGGVKDLTFDKGEQVRFRVRSDVADEIHVHGFDRYADVEAGQSVTIAFAAKFDGIYEVEMHGTGTQVAALRIVP